MQAGKYYVGDLCYVMHPQWDEFCTKTCSGHDVIDGEITLDNGVKIAQYGTAFGDGVYEDQFGNDYGVDAGLIGCIRVEDINDPNADLQGGHIIEFPNNFETSYDEGIIFIGHLSIDTDPQPLLKTKSNLFKRIKLGLSERNRIWV